VFIMTTIHTWWPTLLYVACFAVKTSWAGTRRK
jgi:hypothetical protein